VLTAISRRTGGDESYGFWLKRLPGGRCGHIFLIVDLLSNVAQFAV